MAAAPVPPETVLQEAKTWWDVVIPVLTGVFGGGIVWGAGRSAVMDHSRRITSLETAFDGGLKRIEDKVDRNHNMLISALLKAKPD